MSSIPARILTSLVILTLILVQSSPASGHRRRRRPLLPRNSISCWHRSRSIPTHCSRRLQPPPRTLKKFSTLDNWLAGNPGLTGDALSNAAQQQGFDPAFIALVQFPDVLQMMADNIVLTMQRLARPWTTNQAAVSDSIQRLRAQAYAPAGGLRSNAQQTVVVQRIGPQTIYVIQPANPQVVYVPQYDPSVVLCAV